MTVEQKTVRIFNVKQLYFTNICTSIDILKFLSGIALCAIQKENYLQKRNDDTLILIIIQNKNLIRFKG